MSLLARLWCLFVWTNTSSDVVKIFFLSLINTCNQLTLSKADYPPYMAESEELKSLLKVKEESEKVGLKLNIQKTKIMASGPVPSLHGK